MPPRFRRDVMLAQRRRSLTVEGGRLRPALVWRLALECGHVATTKGKVAPKAIDCAACKQAA